MVETNLNIFDVVVFTIVGLSALFSFYRGFVREFLSLFTWVGAMIITLYAFKPVNDLLKEKMDNALAVDLISGLGTYLVALLTLSIFTSIILKFIKPGKEVGALDNLLGLIFGILRGVLIVAIGFFGVAFAFNEQGYPDYIKTAVTRPYVEDAAALVASIAPKDLLESNPIQGLKEDAVNNDVETPADKKDYQWDSMDKLQKLIDENKGNTRE